VSPHLRWFVRLHFLLALTLSAVSMASAGDSQWIEIRSRHFSVVTDAGEKRGEGSIKWDVKKKHSSLLLRGFFSDIQPLCGGKGA
jgi:hypothetical protein